jgi:hypothetical protein
MTAENESRPLKESTVGHYLSGTAQLAIRDAERAKQVASSLKMELAAMRARRADEIFALTERATP